MGGSCWQVTDMGLRTIIAIKLNHEDDLTWYEGPPYAVLEYVLDENDLQGCFL